MNCELAGKQMMNDECENETNHQINQ